MTMFNLIDLAAFVGQLTIVHVFGLGLKICQNTVGCMRCLPLVFAGKIEWIE